MEFVDGFVYLGCNFMDIENIYVIIGDFGNGFINCMIGVWFIIDMIVGCKNVYEKIYDFLWIVL